MEIKALKTPFIPVAQYDGLIRVIDLENDLVVNLEAWFNIEPTDSYQLILNGVLAGGKQIAEDAAPGTELTLVLDKQELESDGIYQIAYRATDELGGAFADSPAVTIRVDRSSPGAALLAPIIPNIPNSVSGLIPGYAGMEPGDVIQITCNGIACQSITVMPEHMHDTPISFTQILPASQSSESSSLQYVVTDRAGNVSRASLATLLPPTN